MLWSSLYLGTGELERQLVDTACATMRARPALRTTIVMDGARCARTLGANSTCEQLSRLQRAAAPQQCRVWLFESPRLRGGVGDVRAHVSRALVRSGRAALARWREATGVWHMKIYIFDDTLVISGANLSDTYFSTRQDRYVVFRDAPLLCDFYAQFFDAVTRTPSGFELPLDFASAAHWNTLMSTPGECERARELLAPFIAPHASTPATNTAAAADLDFADSDTWVFPSFQMAPFGIRQDEHITAHVLGESSTAPSSTSAQLSSSFPRGDLWLASGYLNLPPRFEAALVASAAHARTHLLSAAPQANGWYGAQGIGGKVPALYAAVEYHMMQRLARLPPTARDNVRVCLN